MIKNHRKEIIPAIYEWKLEMYEESMSRKELIKDTPETALPGLFDAARRFFATESRVNPNSERAWQALTYAHQLGVGHFQSVMHDGEPFMLELGDEQLLVTGKFHTHNISADFWIRAFFLAVMARSAESVNILSQVNRSVLEADSVGQQTEFDFALVELLQGVYAPDAPLAQLMLNSMGAFDPDELTDARFFNQSRLLLPVDSILRTIFEPQGEAAFNEAMEKALKLHREYYVKEDKMAEEGLVSIPLTALAVIAYDHQGYRVRVENEYIPDWVVTANRCAALTEFTSDPNVEVPSGAAPFKNTPIQVKQAVLQNDYDELEGFREIDHSEWLPDLIHAFETSDDWNVRNALAYLLQDRRGDPAVKELYEQALESPTLMIRAIALIVLHGDIDLWDTVMVDNEFNEEAVARLKGEYLKRKTQNS